MTRALRPGLAGALVALAAAGAAPAQEISGIAIDAGGAPIPEAPVALHRIGGGGGATVDAATTGRDGRFRFEIQSADSAVYFVALRHEDRLYIGPPARGGAERVTDYVLRAEPASEAGAVASALSGAAPGRTGPGTAPPAAPAASTGAAVLLIALLALAVAGGILSTAPGYRRRRQREALVELAGIENRLSDPGSGGDAEADRRRRDALRERLAPPR